MVHQKSSEESNGLPEGAAGGPSCPFALSSEDNKQTPVTTRRTTKQRWRPFCFRESEEEKEANNTFKHIKELLKPSTGTGEDAADTLPDIEETVQ